MKRGAGAAPLLLTALVVFQAVALGACGRKGNPVAPETREPRPVANLTAVPGDDGIGVSWSNPTRRLDNSPLRPGDLVRARVYRAEDAGAGEAKPALRVGRHVAGYTPIADLRLDDPGDAVVQGTQVTLTDRRDLAFGRRYTYVVLTEDAQGRTSAPSNRLVVGYIAPPGIPSDVVANAGDTEVRLRWAPMAVAAGDTIAYEVLRAAGPDAGLQPITPMPIEASEYVDRAVQNDRAYAYAVRAVRTRGSAAARGPASERIVATPLDRTPPAAPSALVAAVAGDTVRLSWRASLDADVGGYVVYRAAGPGPFARIGSTRAPLTTFVDREVAPGAFRYVVTAEDQSASANESARSNEASVSVP